VAALAGGLVHLVQADSRMDTLYRQYPQTALARETVPPSSEPLSYRAVLVLTFPIHLGAAFHSPANIVDTILLYNKQLQAFRPQHLAS
jgi:hypothetical protein